MSGVKLNQLELIKGVSGALAITQDKVLVKADALGRPLVTGLDRSTAARPSGTEAAPKTAGSGTAARPQPSRSLLVGPSGAAAGGNSRDDVHRDWGTGTSSSGGGGGSLELELAVKGIEQALNMVGGAMASDRRDAASGATAVASRTSVPDTSTPGSETASWINPSEGAIRSDFESQPVRPPPSSSAAATTATSSSGWSEDETGDSHVMLRCGQLALSADVYDQGDEIHVQVCVWGGECVCVWRKCGQMCGVCVCQVWAADVRSCRG